MAAQIFLISVWPNSIASTTVSSLHFFRARLDHHDAIGGADDHDVQHALAHFVVCGIDDELAVDQADAHGADRTEERNVGKRAARHDAPLMPQNVRIVTRIGREHERDDLRLALESLGEHRTHRPIDLAAGEHFALAHAAFALDEASGETSAGVGVFAVIDGERERNRCLRADRRWRWRWRARRFRRGGPRRRRGPVWPIFRFQMRVVLPPARSTVTVLTSGFILCIFFGAR